MPAMSRINPAAMRMIATPNATRARSRTLFGAQSKRPAIPSHVAVVFSRHHNKTVAATLEFRIHDEEFTRPL